MHFRFIPHKRKKNYISFILIIIKILIFFQGFGHLRDVVIKDGFGFVEFEDNRDAEGELTITSE